jgi:hypothetical protein
MRASILTLGLIAVVLAPILLAADFSPMESRAWARFIHPVKFDDTLLPEGNYLFVHDDEAKIIGEPCLYVYPENDLSKPLVAVHCRRAYREAPDQTKIVWVRSAQGVELREFQSIQFAGEGFAHYVR